MLVKTNNFKQLLLMMIIANCVILLSFFSLYSPKNTSFESTYYKEKIDLFNQLPITGHQIIFVGDSITDNAEWHELFPGIRITNRGIQGDTIRGISDRLANISKTKANKVFLMAGINDLYRKHSLREIISSFEQVIDQLSINHKSVFIQSTLHVSSKDKSINHQIILLNKALKKLSYKHKNTFFIDVNLHLAPNQQLRAEYTFDGIHLNGLGYLKWQAAIKTFVKQ